jgi:hypothetical protein
MNNSEKNRLAAVALDCWHSFEEALAGSKRTYPPRKFLSFVGAARQYIEATRHDQLVRRDVANAINGLTEHLRLERKRVPGRVLSEADRLERLFFGGSTRTSRERNHPVFRTTFCGVGLLGGSACTRRRSLQAKTSTSGGDIPAFAVLIRSCTKCTERGVSKALRKLRPGATWLAILRSPKSRRQRASTLNRFPRSTHKRINRRRGLSSLIFRPSMTFARL